MVRWKDIRLNAIHACHPIVILVSPTSLLSSQLHYILSDLDRTGHVADIERRGTPGLRPWDVDGDVDVDGDGDVALWHCLSSV